jgi:DNA replication and repair protein RecF
MITSIRLQNFRTYRDELLELDKGVNIIVGPNASGKTNLLEAVLVASRGKSYRGKDIELVRFKDPWARLLVHTELDERLVKIEVIDTQKTTKTFTIGGRDYKRLPASKTLPIVLFEPENLQLLRGSPEIRREFLDNLLSQTVSGYSVLVNQYKRALSQRNAFLKSGRTLNYQALFPWNVRLGELGGQIAEQRLKLINRLNEELGPVYSQISGKNNKISASYETVCAAENYASSLLHKLEAHTEQDLERGFTSYGPHRDDLSLELDGHKVQESGSRGEVRTLLLSLKVSELKMIEEARGQKPILLLDDVFSELDGARRQALTKFISGYQAFITTTDADVVVHHFMDTCHIIPTTTQD